MAAGVSAPHTGLLARLLLGRLAFVYGFGLLMWPVTGFSTVMGASTVFAIFVIVWVAAVTYPLRRRGLEIGIRLNAHEMEAGLAVCAVDGDTGKDGGDG